MEASSMMSLSSNVSLYEVELKFYFVFIDGGPTDKFQEARNKLKEHVGENNIIDTNSHECSRFMQNVTRKDIFVLNQFSGKVFDKLCQTEALVVGPPCIITCFMDNEMIPNNKSAVFSMAMRGLIVTLSAFPIEQKRELRKLIAYMGGRCIDQFTENITHLVTDKVVSTKYEQAAIREKPIMKSDWVRDVWTQSATENIHATDPCFDKHRVPVFYNLAMTTTGLKERIKLDIKRLIEENGGQYYGEFSTSKINILILDMKPKESPKWKAAISSKKDCLTHNWIYESVEAGFALPLGQYTVESTLKPTASTPERQAANFSVASNMSNVSYANTVNETNVSQTSVGSHRSSPEASEQETTSPLQKIALQDAKKAGLFLDGCNIFACGFATEEDKKISKILNSGGATRYDTITSNVTHILVGKPTKADVAMLHAVKNDAVMLKLDWLVESIAKKSAITNYERFLYRLGGAGKKADAVEEASSVPSPASKRNILSMSGNMVKQPNRRRLEFQNNDNANKPNASAVDSQADLPINENMENLILDQYLNASVNKDKPTFKVPAPVGGAAAAKAAVPEPLMSNYVPMNHDDQSIDFDDSSSASSRTGTECNFLEGKKVYIYGFDDESNGTLVQECQTAGAVIVAGEDNTQIVDYMILAHDIQSIEGVKIKARKTVNQFWLLNAKKENKETDVEYYFEPIIFPETLNPLTGMIIVFSTYGGDERSFLSHLAAIMGAEVQDSFRKANRPLLICPTNANAKYEAAIKWNLPVVTCEWLLTCYKKKKRVPLKKFLLGDSISPVDDVSDTETPPEEPEPEPIINEQTPQRVAALENRRLSLLRPTSASTSKSPSTPAAQKDALFNSFDTPEGAAIRQNLNLGGTPDTPGTSSDTNTPDSKRGRFDENAGTPYYATSPYFKQQKRKYLQERIDRYKSTEGGNNKKKSTPWTEYKRRFWKNALGDDYESPSQCMSANTQATTANTPAFTQVNSTINATMPGRQLVFDTQAANANLVADANIQKLDDFIKNREKAANIPERIPDTAPRMHELELPNTELPEIVGWGNSDQRRMNNAMRFRGTPYFSISLSSDPTKVRIKEQIRKLNGRICENLQNYDKTCTHLLCDRPNRGEKTCCCIASGKWVLSSEYIEKSIEAGRFLDEELFEWGNPKAAKNLPALTEQEEPFANAAYRLRKRMELTGVGVYKELCAIIRTSKNENMRNLIEAGHGKVLNDDKSKPLSAQKDILSAATHLIIQPKFAQLSADDIKAVKRANIICVNLNYLNACITTDTEELDPNPYLIKM